jgi:hypothetical protein
MAGITKGVSSKRRSEIFLRVGLDMISGDLPVGQITPVSRPDSEGYILRHSSICSLIGARLDARLAHLNDVEVDALNRQNRTTGTTGITP